MFRNVQDFLETWKAESESTLRVFGALTDASLSQSVQPGSYTLGSLATHITGVIVRMPANVGLLPMPDSKPVLASVGEIVAAYQHNAAQVAEAVSKKWSDAQLGDEVPIFGRTLRKGAVLALLISHQAHHRAQMTVLMRQAGLKVPGIYGASEADRAAKS
jgi:uncharacterized damage-inducible protein DinB